MEHEIHQKEYSIGKILSEAWKIFQENFQLILAITVIIYIPINAILFFTPAVQSSLEPENTLRGIKHYIQGVQIVEGLIGIIAIMAIAWIVKSRIDGKTVDFSQAMKKSLSKWPAALGTSALSGIYVILLSFLLIIPGIIHAVYWIFVSYVVILHDKSGKNAMDYSKSIVKGRWWKVAGYTFVITSLGLLLGLAFAAIDDYLPQSLSENIFANILIGTIGDLAGSYLNVAFAIFFINFDSTKMKNLTSENQNSR